MSVDGGNGAMDNPDEDLSAFDRPLPKFAAPQSGAAGVLP